MTDVDFDEHRYCQKCGSKMGENIASSSTPYFYNKITGKPMYMVYKRCPNYAPNTNHDYRTTYTENLPARVQ